MNAASVPTHDFPSHRLITVEVTVQDIENGHRRNNWSDPIAQALWRATNEKWVVRTDTCYPITRRNAFIPLPPEVVKWIREYDDTGRGSPFTFQLEVPCQP